MPGKPSQSSHSKRYSALCPHPPPPPPISACAASFSAGVWLGQGWGRLFLAKVLPCTSALKIARWRRMNCQGSLGPEAKYMGSLDCFPKGFHSLGVEGRAATQVPSHRCRRTSQEEYPLIQSSETVPETSPPLPSLPFPAGFGPEATQQAGWPTDWQPCSESSESRANLRS